MSTASSSFMNRNLEHYPANSSRIWYLTLSVAATFVLYYEAYVLPSVAPLVLKNYNMSFSLYIFSGIAAGALGAVSSLLGSMADRIGRANMVVYGVLITSILTIATTFATTLWLFFLLTWMVGFVEGIILVATPALVRDFSPQLRRATAMAFWTIGHVGCSLLATTVTSQTITIFGIWQSQYIISGVVGLAIAILCFFGLRDLSPSLRAQIMVTMQERVLLEARARGIDMAATMKNPWKQMLRPQVLISAIGVSIFLLLYYALVGYGPILFNSVFKYPLALANGLLGIYWIVDIMASLVGGFLSDRLDVRKPFMVIGTVGNILINIVFISRIGQPTSPLFMGTLLALTALTGPIAYVSWMAAFTETLEAINPALVATGIAIWGFTIRVVVVLSTLGFSFVVTNVVNPGQWATWWWIGVGGLVVFLPTVWLTTGYWSPASARAATKARLEEEGIAAGSAVGSA